MNARPEVKARGMKTVALLVVFGETPRWNLLVSYALILGAVFFAFKF